MNETETSAASMEREIVVDDDGHGVRTYIEIGVQAGDNIIDLHAEDTADAVDLRLTVDEALAMIDSLTRAVRAALTNS